jgi:hypothetical protein
MRYPALDVKIDASIEEAIAIADLVLAIIDDFSPTGAQELDGVLTFFFTVPPRAISLATRSPACIRTRPWWLAM